MPFGARLRSGYPLGRTKSVQQLFLMAAQVVVGTVSFDIIGKTWEPRGRRGREVKYLILFTNCAAGEEDWVPARKIMCAVTIYVATLCHA
jgi:hypothetical protein